MLNISRPGRAGVLAPAASALVLDSSACHLQPRFQALQTQRQFLCRLHYLGPGE